MNFFGPKNQQPRRSFTSSMLDAAQKGLSAAQRVHAEYKNPTATGYQNNGFGNQEQQIQQQEVFTTTIDDYPQFTQTILDAIVTGKNRYFQNMSDKKRSQEIRPILKQIANLDQDSLMGVVPLPFKPKKGNFFGYKGGVTRRKKRRGKKSRKH